MPSTLSRSLNDHAVCAPLLQQLDREVRRRFYRDHPFVFMEVCGTHTVSIFRSGLAALLPDAIRHLSGPGCPVCVTHDRDIACLIDLALTPGIRIATFGDMLRIPDPAGRTLKWAKARGARIDIIYSPLDAPALARKWPKELVVFPAVGFETTAPGIAAAILAARNENLPNFAVVPLNKRVAPALDALCGEHNNIHGFLLPGHVCAITGCAPFAFLPEHHDKCAAVGGFEAADILCALLSLIRQHAAKKPCVANTYARVVAWEGNPKAVRIMEAVFECADALWRGLGNIPASGFVLRPEYEGLDALKRPGLTPGPAPVSGEEHTPCRCGEVLKGRIRPRECPLFGRACTPAHPVGPCMVSGEGSCAAEYAYLL